MFNDKDFDVEISASELNKFTYCNYQWYYEKIYGKKYISEARKEMLEELGYEDTAKSNFVKGQKFHSNYKDKFVIGNKIIIAVLVIIVICFVIFYYWV